MAVKYPTGKHFDCPKCDGHGTLVLGGKGKLEDIREILCPYCLGTGDDPKKHR